MHSTANHILSRFTNGRSIPDTVARCLMWIFPFLLIVPNIALAFTEHEPFLTTATDIVLPLGVYFLVMGITRSVGASVLLCLPLMVYAGFQIVLLYLYGNSIIAVDMFLNVATTNVSEATELLGNLVAAIVVICVLYLPPIGVAIWLLFVRGRAGKRALRFVRCAGWTGVTAGVVLLALSYAFIPGYNILRDVFPANVISNMVTAIKRTGRTARYYDMSADFSYKATTVRQPSEKELYILVIGETSRAANWQLMGYERPTNPALSKCSGVVAFPKALSESNITHKSVPLLLSWTDARNFGDSIYTTKSILTAFGEAGYRTAFISNQARNRSFIDFFGREAHYSRYLIDDGRHHYDKELLPELRKFISESPSNKMFVVLHTYGGHFNYNDRYPASEAIFTPDASSWARKDNRAQLINAYDNTVVYTDALLDSVIGIASQQGCPAAMIYVADHGEDIFDDDRDRFLHASPTPTYYQLHVPLVLWMSEEYASAYPDAVANAKDHSALDVATTRTVFPTMLSIAGICSPYVRNEDILTHRDYRPAPRRYLNDYNEGVSLDESGMREADFEQLAQKGISDR